MNTLRRYFTNGDGLTMNGKGRSEIRASILFNDTPNARMIVGRTNLTAQITCMKLPVLARRSSDQPMQFLLLWPNVA